MGMEMKIEFWHVVTLAVFIITGYWALTKVIINQFSEKVAGMKKDLEKKIDDHGASVADHGKRLTKAESNIAALPTQEDMHGMRQDITSLVRETSSQSANLVQVKHVLHQISDLLLNAN